MPEAPLLFESGPPGEGAPTEGAPDDEPRRLAMNRAGRLLTARPRSVHEVTTRLESAGFDPDVVAAVVDRLRDLKLLDDGAFARQWVEERSSTRGSRMLVAELRKKGIDLDTIEVALEEARAAEYEDARALAAARVGKLADRPPADQARWLQDLLLRRGFSYEVVEEAVRAVLPPEGWD